MNERIRKLRKYLELTQEEFAKKIHVSRSNLGNLENGIINITDRVISDICEVFNVSIEWLKEGTGEMFNDDEDVELVYLIGALAADGSDFKKKIITFMLKQSDENWNLIENMITEFNKCSDKNKPQN